MPDASIATKDDIVQSDYFGIVSANDVPDKVKKAGFTISRPCRSKGHAIEHRLDKIGMGSQNGIILSYEGSNERCKEIHTHLEATITKTICNSSYRIAHHMAFSLKEGCSKGIDKTIAIRCGVTLDREKGIALRLVFSLDSLDINTFLGEALYANGTTTAQYTTCATYKRLSTNAIKEHTIEATINKQTIVKSHDVGDILRIRGTVKTETLTCSLIII